MTIVKLTREALSRSLPIPSRASVQTLRTDPTASARGPVREGAA